jgi:LysR substrate binding domain
MLPVTGTVSRRSAASSSRTSRRPSRQAAESPAIPPPTITTSRVTRPRQLAERAQTLGVRLQPKVEVELKDIALRLVAAGIGDTYLPSAYTRAPYYPQGLSTASFTPALYDTFAIITRPAARLSPGVRELLTDLETHMRTIADELDGST